MHSLPLVGSPATGKVLSCYFNVFFPNAISRLFVSASASRSLWVASSQVYSHGRFRLLASHSQAKVRSVVIVSSTCRRYNKLQHNRPQKARAGHSLRSRLCAKRYVWKLKYGFVSTNHYLFIYNDDCHWDISEEEIFTNYSSNYVSAYRLVYSSYKSGVL